MEEDFLSTIDEIIEDARNGRMFILVDDEDRENEGDLVIPAQMATPEAINFMATHGRGLVCMPMTSQRIRELGLPLMSHENESRHQTAFTVSIEAKEGITTGISAADRARTVAVAIDASKTKNDLATPGHVFPLAARDGGVLVRAGHTEASVDIARIAGLNPAAVICEIMNEDGTMARMNDLIAFAQLHGLKVGTIRDLIAYRHRHDNLVEVVASDVMKSVHGGEWESIAYANTAEYAEHLVLKMGTIDPDQPTLVRVHVLDMFGDVLDEVGERQGLLGRTMEIIAEEGRGIVLIIRDTRPTRLSDMIKARTGGAPDTRHASEVRDYGIGAQILLDLGVRDMILLSNTEQTVVGLEGYGMNIVAQKPIEQTN